MAVQTYHQMCAELSDMINDSFFKKLDKYFDQQKEKNYGKRKT